MRLLIVGFPDSVHVARALNQIADQGWDIHLFPVYEERCLPTMRNLTFHTTLDIPASAVHPSVRIRRFRGVQATLDAPRRLAEVIRELKPDVIHSMELQHASYLTLDARDHVAGPFPIWIVSNWGSDIYLFGRIPHHAARIRTLLSLADYYGCECCRDVALARKFGFRGEVLPVLPIGGGFDLAHAALFRSPGPTSARRVVVLKGYQNWAGRALVGLKALELAAAELQGYRVIVYTHFPDVALTAELASQATGIPFEVMPRSSHEDMLRLFGRARVYLGLSISDAISTSLLEAMVMGAFPIQSHTSCANEWVADGESGMIVPPEDPHVIVAALRRALTDDALVDGAAAHNAVVCAQRLDVQRIAPQVVEMYRQVIAGGPSPHTAGERPTTAVSAWNRLAQAEQWLQVRESQLAEKDERVRSLCAELESRRLAWAEKDERVRSLSAELEGRRLAWDRLLAEKEERVRSLSAELEGRRLEKWYVRLGRAAAEWVQRRRESHVYRLSAGFCRRLGLTQPLKRYARRLGS